MTSEDLLCRLCELEARLDDSRTENAKLKSFVAHTQSLSEIRMARTRLATIEDCARVADKECEESSDPQQAMTAMGIAAEIRALADKEPA